MADAVAYNANDSVQQSFLSALALGESGGSANPYSVGYGGTDLTGSPTDQYGFPTWSGVGNTHAAGAFQFQPGTWAGVASEYGLDFNNPQDQNAGAWYEAQKADPTLESDLQAGNFSKVQSALAKIWPSVMGSASNPQGLAGAIGAGAGSTIAGASVASPTSAADAAASANPFAIIENWFLRGGLIIVGGIVVVIALYFLLSNNGVIPKVSKLASAI